MHKIDINTNTDININTNTDTNTKIEKCKYKHKHVARGGEHGAGNIWMKLISGKAGDGGTAAQGGERGETKSTPLLLETALHKYETNTKIQIQIGM